MCNASHAEEQKPNFSYERLTRNWLGLRDTLYDKGYEFDFYYKLDAWRNVSGGVQQGNRVLGNLDLKMLVDGEKAFGIHGTTFQLYLLNNNGGRPNDLVGSNGGIDNIEVPTHAFKLYEAWIQKNFWDDKVSILAGLHDLNSEFYVTDTSGIFINPTYGIGTEMASTGDNGPSIFPATSLGLRLALQPTQNTYFMGAVYDGVSGDPENPRGTHMRLKDKDGALLVAESGVHDNQMGHLGVGVWAYTAKRPDQVSSEGRNSKGIYFLADRSLYSKDDKDISAFGRLGYTAGDVEQFRSNWSLGFVASGFVPKRKDGQIGFALSSNINSGEFKTADPSVDDVETQYEITYSDKLMPWLTIQPDLQYTHNPGTDQSNKNAWTAGIRAGIDF